MGVTVRAMGGDARPSLAVPRPYRGQGVRPLRVLTKSVFCQGTDQTSIARPVSDSGPG